MGVGLNWTVGELGICVTISHTTAVGEMGVGLNWTVGELGIYVRISHTTAVGEMGVGEMGMNS